MELEAKAIDTYLVQLENNILGLGQDIIEQADPINLEQAFILTGRFKERHPELYNVTFIRGDGQILFAATSPPSPKLPTLAMQPSFIKFCDELKLDNPISVGQPLEGVLTHEWIIPLRYMINDRDGRPAYIISANLPVEMLLDFWKEAPFTKSAALGLMRDDGFLVSRYPVPDKLKMEKIYGEARTGALIGYLRQENFPASGYVEGASSLDGPNFLNTFQRLDHFPITLFVAMPMSEIFEAWWNKVKTPYMLTTVLLIGVFFFYQFSFRREQVREKERWQASEALRESEDRFRKLFELTAAVKLIIDPNTGNIVEANKAAVEFYGWPIEKLKQMRIQDINTQPSEVVKSEMEKTASESSKRWEFKHRRADGTTRDVEVFYMKEL